MSGISGASSSSSGSASTVGTDLAPITFPGIASGIDYNSIINKLTSLTLEPNTLYNSQIKQLDAKNAELIKINSMLTSVQGSLSALSDPATFNAYLGTSTDPADCSVTQVSDGNAAPGSYTISSTQVATATQINGGSGAGVTINPNLALLCAGTGITPTNGTNGQQGQLTVDGVAIKYDVNSQSLNTIVQNIYTAVKTVDAGFSIAVGANGAVTFSSTHEQISIGSASDNGNLEDVLKLNAAEINNAGPTYSVTSAGPIGGINDATTFSATGHAGFATAVTSGTFTINGVQIAVNASDDNVSSILAKINSSTAGVVASFNVTTDTFSLTNTETGPQSIIVGASNDTSDFLKVAQLTTGTGAATAVGKQAYVAVLTQGGVLQTVYSNSDSVQGAIPGMALNITGSTQLPFTVTVNHDTSLAVNAITNFVSLYNAAMNEIAIATAPPVVQQSQSSTTNTTTSSSVLASGGILYGDQTVEMMSSQLTNIVSSLTSNGSTSFNSLESIGLSLDSSHTVYQSNTDAYGGTVDSSSSGPIATSSADGTDGQFSPLDVSQFTAALTADPSAVASLFVSTSATGTTGLTNQLGGYLTGITGTPSSLVSGLVGNIPAIALIQGDEDADTAEITALNQSIQGVQNKANAQADLLRAQATASEALISKYQSEQSAVNQLSSSSSSSS
jgi:flagellar hook-associated protein 2